MELSFMHATLPPLVVHKLLIKMKSTPHIKILNTCRRTGGQDCLMWPKPCIEGFCTAHHIDCLYKDLSNLLHIPLMNLRCYNCSVAIL